MTGSLAAALERVTALTGCQRCSSPFLRACTAPGWVVCRSCLFLHRLGPRETLDEAGLPVDVATTITGRDDLPQLAPGMAVATRWTVRGVQCQHVVTVRSEG